MSDPEFWYGRGPYAGPNQQHDEGDGEDEHGPHDPGMRRFWNDVRKEMSQQWSAVYKERRQKGIARRQEEVAKLLSQEPVLPDWLALTPESELTEKQREACVLLFGYELKIAEAARHIGISHVSMRERLQYAQKKVEAYWGTWDALDIPLGLQEDISPEHMQGYVFPLIHRQNAIQTLVERLGAP